MLCYFNDVRYLHSWGPSGLSEIILPEKRSVSLLLWKQISIYSNTFKTLTLIWKFRYDICVINVCQKLLYNSPRTVSEEALTLPVASESTLRAIVYVQFTRGGGGGGGAGREG